MIPIRGPQILGPLFSTSFNTKFSSIMGRLTMSVVGRSAFAVEVDAFQTEETDFLKFAKKVFNFTFTHPAIIFMSKNSCLFLVV